MSDPSKPIDAREQYAAAHYAHYTERQLAKALELYGRIVAAHPNAPEAAYSRSQIQSILDGVDEKRDFFTTELELASALVGDPTGKAK